MLLNRYALLMAECSYFPERPYFGTNTAEEALFGELLLQLPQEASLFHSIKYFDGDREYEIDFLIAHPDLGIALLEVKGGQLRQVAGGWEQFSHSDSSWHYKDIRKQLGLNNRWIVNLLRNQFGQQLPPVREFLIAPDAGVRDAQLVGGIPRANIIDHYQVADLWSIVSEDLEAKLDGYQYQSASVWTGQIAFLREQFHAYQNSYADVVRSTQHRGLAIDSLSRNQVALLDFMSDNNRMLIRGGPGSGKTVLAIEQASLLAAKGLKVGIICYNIGLSQYLVKTAGSLPKHKRPDFKGSFETLATLWGVSLPVAPDARAARDKFYRTEVPGIMQRRVETLTHDEKFDAWIVDEAQELHPGHWKVLKDSLRDPQQGIIHAFGDKDQEIFRRDEDESGEVDWHLRLPWSYARGTLKKNLRNTRTIARLLESLSSRAAEPAGPFDGFTPEFVLVPEGLDIHEVAERFVNYVSSNYSWAPEHILVINTGEKSSKHLAQQGADKIKYWNTFLKSKDVFHTHVSVVKGLERPVVVLVLDKFGAESKIDQQMYVGISRALEDVIIIGKQKEFDQLGDFFTNFTPSPFNDLIV